MKAAVIYPDDNTPRYIDLPDPVPQGEDEVMISVKAVAIKHIDRSRASGKHYSSDGTSTPRIIGGDGVGLLEDGTRVYAIGGSGMLAEKAIVSLDRIVPLPATLDDATAAALPNAVIGAAMGLRFKADVQPGDTVLINGATGFTGRVAVQIAKYYGAGRVIATGRNLASLKELDADEVIPLDEAFSTRLTGMSFDVVIDYLWGKSAEAILASIKGNGHFTNRIRYVSVGSMTGDKIELSAAGLRSVDLQLSGSGMGAWSKAQVGQLLRHILPEMFELAAAGKLKVNTTTARIEDIAGLWDADVAGGQRLVVLV